MEQIFENQNRATKFTVKASAEALFARTLTHFKF